MYIIIFLHNTLHTIGTLLHFDDHGLKHIYFLDPQWLAKLMANVIQPAAAEEGSPIKNGKTSAMAARQLLQESMFNYYTYTLGIMELCVKGTGGKKHIFCISSVLINYKLGPSTYI